METLGVSNCVFVREMAPWLHICIIRISHTASHSEVWLRLDSRACELGNNAAMVHRECLYVWMEKQQCQLSFCHTYCVSAQTGWSNRQQERTCPVTAAQLGERERETDVRRRVTELTWNQSKMTNIYQFPTNVLLRWDKTAGATLSCSLFILPHRLSSCSRGTTGNVRRYPQPKSGCRAIINLTKN